MMIVIIIIAVTVISIVTWIVLRFPRKSNISISTQSLPQEINSPSEDIIEVIDDSAECVKARQRVSEAITSASNFPHISRSVVKTQVQLFPHAFTAEERKYLIDWSNN